jgi:hypothetical protein
VLELPFTLILASRVFKSGMGPREWGSILAMTAGLAGLLYFLSPTAGRSDEVRLYIWLIGIGANLALVGVLVLWGRLDPHRFRRHHPKWHDGLRGENRTWDRLARSTPRNIRMRLWSW